jgi:putative transposase
MDVQGVSTRKVAAVTEQLCGTNFSKSQVSALAGRLDAELAAWRERELNAPYWSVDARDEHVRVDGRVVGQGVLIVAGVRADGRCKILTAEVADTESEATYSGLWRTTRINSRAGVAEVMAAAGSLQRSCQGGGSFVARRSGSCVYGRVDRFATREGDHVVDRTR